MLPLLGCEQSTSAFMSSSRAVLRFSCQALQPLESWGLDDPDEFFPFGRRRVGGTEWG